MYQLLISRIQNEKESELVFSSMNYEFQMKFQHSISWKEKIKTEKQRKSELLLTRKVPSFRRLFSSNLCRKDLPLLSAEWESKKWAQEWMTEFRREGFVFSVLNWVVIGFNCGKIVLLVWICWKKAPRGVKMTKLFFLFSFPFQTTTENFVCFYKVLLGFRYESVCYENLT